MKLTPSQIPPEKGPSVFKIIRVSGHVELHAKTYHSYPHPHHYKVVHNRTQSTFTFTPQSHTNPLKAAQEKFEELAGLNTNDE